MTTTLLTSLHLFICVLLIILVLLQQGKGADAGATFGGGGNTVFGAAGADNFLTKFTTVIAIFFMLSSVVLGLQGRDGSASSGDIFQGVAKQAAPVNTAVAADGNAPDNAEIQKEIATEIEKVKAEKANAAKATGDSVSTNSASNPVSNSVPDISSDTASKVVTRSVEAAQGASKATAETANNVIKTTSDSMKKVVSPITKENTPQ